MSYNDVGSLKKAVESNGGVLTISMNELRDAFGARRLGVHVREGITTRLQNEGIAHYPEELPNSQFAGVRLFMTDSPVGEVIRAIAEPDPNMDSFILSSIRKRPGRMAKTSDSAEPTASSAVKAEAATETSEPAEPPKRGRGRPRKNPTE